MTTWPPIKAGKSISFSFVLPFSFPLDPTISHGRFCCSTNICLTPYSIWTLCVCKIRHHVCYHAQVGLEAEEGCRPSRRSLERSFYSRLFPIDVWLPSWRRGALSSNQPYWCNQCTSFLSRGLPKRNPRVPLSREPHMNPSPPWLHKPHYLMLANGTSGSWRGPILPYPLNQLNPNHWLPLSSRLLPHINSLLPLAARLLFPREICS